jgi:probable phosphoglycerate mutase
MKLESLIQIAGPAAAPPEVELSLFERDRTSTALQQVFLVRHAETEWSLSGQHTGMTDVPLTEHGREMARRLEPVFAHEQLTLVLTSPLRRARTTCALAGLSEQCDTDWDLHEWDYGDFEGLTMSEIQARAPGWNLFRDGSPHGETPEQVAERADRVIEKVRAARGQVAVFAHGHILRVFAARWLGLAPSAGEHFLLDTTTLNILTYYHGVPAIKQWNAPLGPSAADRLEDA